MSVLAAFGALFGALGMGFSLTQGIFRAQEKQDEIWIQQNQERIRREAQIKEQKARAEREISYATGIFKKEQEDAFRKADDIWHQGERIDMRADLNETLTGRAFNLAMQKNNMEDESLLLQQQRGKQNFLNRQGTQQAALGMSGVRHGANSAEQVLEQNKENFTQELDLMNRQRETQKEINLMQAFTNLKRGMFGIDEERDQANKAFRDSKQLRDDYSEGGRVVNLFNQKISNLRKDLQGSIDLQNLDGGFKQYAYQRAYDRAEYTWIDGITDAARGLTSGVQFGTKIANFGQSWGGYGGGLDGGLGNDVMAAGQAGGLSNLFSRYKDPFGAKF